MNPLLMALVKELRTRGLDVEYKGEGDTLHLVGDKRLADESVMAALKAAKNRILKALKPIWDEGDGKPVRLPQGVEDRAERLHR